MVLFLVTGMGWDGIDRAFYVGFVRADRWMREVNFTMTRYL